MRPAIADSAGSFAVQHLALTPAPGAGGGTGDPAGARIVQWSPNGTLASDDVTQGSNDDISDLAVSSACVWWVTQAGVFRAPRAPDGSAGAGSGGSGGANAAGEGGGTGAAGGNSWLGCADGYIDVVVDGAAPEHWTSICAESWGWDQTAGPVGYDDAGGQLVIEGCPSAKPGDDWVHMTPTSFAWGPPTWTEMSSGTLNVTKADPVGGYIEGTFSFQVSYCCVGSAAVSGSFRVCHVKDEPGP